VIKYFEENGFSDQGVLVLRLRSVVLIVSQHSGEAHIQVGEHFYQHTDQGSHCPVEEAEVELSVVVKHQVFQVEHHTDQGRGEESDHEDREEGEDPKIESLELREVRLLPVGHEGPPQGLLFVPLELGSVLLLGLKPPSAWGTWVGSGKGRVRVRRRSVFVLCRRKGKIKQWEEESEGKGSIEEEEDAK
jgi:hypothetical protein